MRSDAEDGIGSGIMRKNREKHCVTALEWRPEGRRRPGRPKTTWRRMVEDERRAAGWQSWMTVRALAPSLMARRDIEIERYFWSVLQNLLA